MSERGCRSKIQKGTSKSLNREIPNPLVFRLRLNFKLTNLKIKLKTRYKIVYFWFWYFCNCPWHWMAMFRIHDSVSFCKQPDSWQLFWGLSNPGSCLLESELKLRDVYPFCDTLPTTHHMIFSWALPCELCPYIN